MTPREKRLLIFLVTAGSLIGVLGGYLLIYSPIQEKKAQVRQLQKEIDDKEQEKAYFIKAQLAFHGSKDSPGYKNRSLPPNVPLAQREYGIVLNELLVKAGLPKANFSVTVKSASDPTRTPTVPLPLPPGAPPNATAKEKPAYTKIVADLKLTRVDLPVLAEFLRAYSDLELLQQITSMKITRREDNAGAGARRTGREPGANWKDLIVDLTCEAIILDGAEDRRTLVVFPRIAQSGIGGAMFAALSGNSEAGRWLAHAQAAINPPQLSGPDSRQYLALMARDMFHGPVPKEPEPPPVRLTTSPPKPKEDISRFIKLTDITRRSDGSAKFEIHDVSNNFYYEGELTPKGEQITVLVQKWERMPNGKILGSPSYKKPLLHITDEGRTGTDRVFRVVAVDQMDGLILAGAGPSVEKAPGPGNGSRPAPGGRPSGGGRPTFSPPAKLPTPTPHAALVGGSVAATGAAAEKLWYWRGSLAELREITQSEFKEIIRRNQAMGLNAYISADMKFDTAEALNKGDDGK